MTRRQKHLIKISFEKLVPVSETVTFLFYARLVELNPDFCNILCGEFNRQTQKLMRAVGTVVKSLDNLDDATYLAAGAEKSDIHHNLENKESNSISEAFSWTLAQILKKDFTLEMQEAWQATSKLLAQTVRETLAICSIYQGVTARLA